MPRAADELPLTVVCFAQAGAGASSFIPFAKRAPPSMTVVSIQYPGRERRIGEELATDLEALLAKIRPQLESVLRARTFAFFGHSLGALVAFEVARDLRRRSAPGPAHLFVSGCPAPHLTSRRPKTLGMSEPAFVAFLRSLGGTPELLLEDAEARAIFLPILRADFGISERYQHDDEPPLDCPISVFGGASDPIANATELAAWKQHTRSPFTVEILPGDHNFVHGQWETIGKAMEACRGEAKSRSRGRAR